MKKALLRNFSKNAVAMGLMWAMFALPLAVLGQTRVSMPKNGYSIQDDVRAGREAAAQVERQMPVLNDAEATNYVQQVGRRLVNAIPSEFQQPEFQYTFKIINARDINAFALPGGPMYVNRGMIEAARNEGEMAGVMAHEIAHVALRHGTAGATKSRNPTAQLPAIGGAILGAILGGVVGGIAQTAGQLGSAAIVTSYSREYETQADILGSQIMARAGYDPIDLANMFRTIEQQSGGSRAPQWLSSHPNPGNRYNNISREAQMLRVSPEPIKVTAGFQRTQARLRGYGAAPTMSEIERGQGGGSTSPTAGGTYSRSVPLPSTRATTYNSGGLYVNYPSNWRAFPSQESILFAPEGAYGNNGISHGALVGVTQGSGNLQQDTNNLAQQFAQQNGYQAAGGYFRTTMNGRSGLGITMRGRSNITGGTEVATLYTAQTRSGGVLYVVTVAPQNQASRYNAAFSNMIRSIRFNN